MTDQKVSFLPIKVGDFVREQVLGKKNIEKSRADIIESFTQFLCKELTKEKYTVSQTKLLKQTILSMVWDTSEKEDYLNLTDSDLFDIAQKFGFNSIRVWCEISDPKMCVDIRL